MPWQSAGAFFAAIALVCLNFSPALGSIFTALSIFVSLVAFIKSPNFGSIPWFFLLLALLVLWQFNFLYPNLIQSEHREKIFIRLPILFMLLNAQWRLTLNHKNMILLLLALPICWISGASMMNYFLHYKFYNVMVLESKPIPLYSIIYHIEYSVFQALLALFLLFHLISSEKAALGSFISTLLWVCFIIIVFALHVFSARTGILSFWLGLIAGGMMLGSKKQLLIGFSATALLAVISVFCIPSIKNRVVNSIEDARAVAGNSDLNHKSFGQRWVAWQVSLKLIKQQPILGYGLPNVRKAMDVEYNINNRGLEADNQVNPHNQYLECGIQNGIPALIVLVWVWLTAFVWAMAKKNPLLLGIATALAVSMLFESILERQAGVLLVYGFLSFSACWWSEIKVSEKKS